MPAAPRTATAARKSTESPVLEDSVTSPQEELTSAGTADKTAPVVPLPDPVQIARKIRTYIAYRKEQLRAPRLGGNPGGSAMIQAANAMGWLNELERFAAWLDEGEPSDASVLTEEDKKFWLRAKDSGLAVPGHILKQLGR